jgi:methyl-accepting chemotaxis protein
MVPDLEEPRWAPFETVHVSLNVKEVLAQQEAPGSSPKGRQVGVSTEELQLQIRELNSSNQELRSRLEEQNKRMQELNGQLEQLRQELTKTKPKTRPSRSAPAQ